MSRASGTQIVYAPHPNTNDDGELNALVAVYRFLLFEKCKKAARPGGPDDAEDLENDRTDTRIIPQ